MPQLHRLPHYGTVLLSFFRADPGGVLSDAFNGDDLASAGNSARPPRGVWTSSLSMATPLCVSRKPRLRPFQYSSVRSMPCFKSFTSFVSDMIWFSIVLIRGPIFSASSFCVSPSDAFVFTMSLCVCSKRSLNCFCFSLMDTWATTSWNFLVMIEGPSLMIRFGSDAFVGASVCCGGGAATAGMPAGGGGSGGGGGTSFLSTPTVL
mmetsp:Transcript_94954/g.183072  ORF Transcript_94954/g.183072 Transcript_94954/m.183072 type:complete len:206 (+) Transcript_94954:244-861(+)